MTTRDPYHIPPVTVPAEILPAALRFQPMPASEWEVDDIVLLTRDRLPALFRIKAIRHSRYTAALSFILWNCAGGRPETDTFMPRQWRSIARGV